MAWTIRRATPEDAEAFRRFAIETFRATYEAVNTPEDMAAYVADSFSPERVASLLADDRVVVLLLEQTEILGYAQASRGHAMEIDRFYIASRLHGSGAAQALMQQLIRTARDDGASSLRLGVWEKNPRAIAFYTKLGFRKIGEQTFVLGSDAQNDWTMELPI